MLESKKKPSQRETNSALRIVKQSVIYFRYTFLLLRATGLARAWPYSLLEPNPQLLWVNKKPTHRCYLLLCPLLSAGKNSLNVFW